MGIPLKVKIEMIGRFVHRNAKRAYTCSQLGCGCMPSLGEIALLSQAGRADRLCLNLPLSFQQYIPEII